MVTCGGGWLGLCVRGLRWGGGLRLRGSQDVLAVSGLAPCRCISGRCASQFWVLRRSVSRLTQAGYAKPVCKWVGGRQRDYVSNAQG